MLFAMTLASWCIALASFQPGPCSEDNQCREQFFCDISVGECHECLSCQTLKREPPPTPSSCVKSIAECGRCLKGLVVDLKSDLSCMPPADGAPTDINYTVWVAAGVVVLFILLGAAAVVVFFFNRSNDRQNTCTSLPTRYDVVMERSAPPLYSERNVLDNHSSDVERRRSDEGHPLIKQYQPPFPDYELHNYQNVSVYNNPYYVRTPDSPPPLAQNQVDVNGNTPAVHDEDTMPSTWSPDANGNTPALHDEDTMPSTWSPDANGNTPALHDEDTMPSTWSPDANGNTLAVHDADTMPSTWTPEERPLRGAPTTPRTQPQRIDDDSAPSGSGAFTIALADARNTTLIQSQPLQMQPRDSTSSVEASSSGNSSHQNAHGGGASARPTQNGEFVINLNVTQVNYNAATWNLSNSNPFR